MIAFQDKYWQILGWQFWLHVLKHGHLMQLAILRMFLSSGLGVLGLDRVWI